jgi:hypothetical protein
MVPPKYDKHVYGVTPPRESDEDGVSDSHSIGENDDNLTTAATFKPDCEKVSDVCEQPTPKHYKY